MTTTTFKGARYITKFADPIEWDADRAYEAIESVQHEGFTYISKQPVPVGVQIDNEAFWLLWADPNAQMEQLRQLVAQYVEDVETLSGTVDDLSDDVDTFSAIVPVSEFSAENTVKKYIDFDISKAHVFDTVADMKIADTLANGMICRTCGFHTVGDAGAAWYEITNSGTADEMSVIACGDLFAHLVVSNGIVTPDIFGAYGDNSHFDDDAIAACMQYAKTNYGDNATVNFSAGKTYKVENTIEIPPYIEVNGNNCNIVSSESGFICDGLYHTQVRDFKMSVQNHAIELTSTSTWSNYNIFENIFAINVNADHTGTYGIYIHPTSNYITEETFDHCVMWHFENGIRCQNTTDKSLGTCTFIRCSTETSEGIGQYLEKANDMTFIYCRHVETNSNKFKTVGECNHLNIYGNATNISNLWELSEDTNGLLLGFYRKGGLYNTSPGMGANIIKGKVIPFVDNRNPRRMNLAAGTTNMPATDSDEIIQCFNHNQTDNPVTLVLDDKYYGGMGKVNSFIVNLNSGSVSLLTIQCGTWSIQIDVSQVGSLRKFKFDYDMTNNTGQWAVQALTYTIADAVTAAS